jgi:hypothetical protein
MLSLRPYSSDWLPLNMRAQADVMFCTNMKQRHVTLPIRPIIGHADQVSVLANVVSKLKQFQAQNAARPLSTFLVSSQRDLGMRTSWSEPP